MSEDHRNPSHLPQPFEGGEMVAGGHAYPAQGQYYYPAVAEGVGGGGDGFDWRRMLAVVWARKWWILGITMLATAAGYLGSRYLIEPIYETRATIWLDEASGPGGGPFRPEEVFQGEGWASLMRSHAVLQPVVSKRNLYVAVQEPSRLGREIFAGLQDSDRMLTGEYTLYSRDGEYRLVHEERGLVESGSLEPGTVIGEQLGFSWMPDPAQLEGVEKLRFELTSLLRGSLNLRSALNVRFDPRGNLIHATISWPDRQEAAEVLNDVVENFVHTAHDLRNRKLAEVVGILERQTDYAASELRDRELALESFRVQSITEPTEEQAAAVPGSPETRRTVTGVYFDQRLESRQIEYDLQQLQRVLAQVRGGDTLNAFALQQIPSVSEAPELRQAIEELYEKEAQRRALTYTYTDAHPEVVELSQDIRTLRQQAIPSILLGLIRQLENRQSALGEQLAAQARELRQIPTRTIEETRRQREYRLAEDIHSRLLSRLREAQLAQATHISDMQVVDHATVPFSPTRNDAPRIIMMAAMAGFGLALGGVLLLDRMDRRIRYPEQITHRLGLPVLGMVPRLENGRRAQPQLAAVAIESFRSIRTQIAHAVGGEGNRVVLITSPAPRDGKSMVAANLAISYASSGKRTVLVDGDTRRGRAEEMFGLPRAPGLMEYLNEEATLDEIHQSTEVEGLSLIARGDRSRFNAELLGSSRMTELLRTLRAEYDSVVVDGPPLAAGADALLLGELSDKVVLVVRAGATDEEMARTKLEMVGNVDLPFVGAVMNAVPDTAPYYEYYANQYYLETA